MSDAPKPNRAEINALRLKAFATNRHEDVMAYYKACSGWFQDEDHRVLARAEHEGALIRAALEAAATSARMAMVANADADEMTCSICADEIRSLANDPEALAAIRKAVEGRG